MKKKNRKQIAKLVSEAIMSGNASVSVENHITSWVGDGGWVHHEDVGRKTITIELDFTK